MQQYFVDQKLNIDDVISLDPEVLYHTKKVLRKDNGYQFRLADNSGSIFLVELLDDKAIVKSDLKENNESQINITAVVSLIKNDKWDLVLQKLTELGVKRIVPYIARRSVVKSKDDKKFIRFNKIVREAAEQSHRNIIPEITPYCDEKHLSKYLSKNNYVAYEKESNLSKNDFNDSVTFIIGPEGGFEPQEIEYFKSIGFKSISLGKRILRAETAAMYLCSLIVGLGQ